jgi:hypothetical protein
VAIHFLPPTIIHSLLLLRQLTDSFANRHALRNFTTWIFAFLSVNTKQSPYPFANLAASRGFDRANTAVLEI